MLMDLLSVLQEVIKNTVLNGYMAVYQSKEILTIVNYFHITHGDTFGSSAFLT